MIEKASPIEDAVVVIETASPPVDVAPCSTVADCTAAAAAAPADTPLYKPMPADDGVVMIEKASPIEDAVVVIEAASPPVDVAPCSTVADCTAAAAAAPADTPLDKPMPYSPNDVPPTKPKDLPKAPPIPPSREDHEAVVLTAASHPPNANPSAACDDRQHCRTRTSEERTCMFARGSAKYFFTHVLISANARLQAS